MEAYSYHSGQIQDNIFVYNNVFHTTGWAGIMFGSWVGGSYTINTPVINNIFYNIALRGDQMVNPSKNAVTHIYGGTCNPGDDLGDSDAELQANNLKDSNFQNNCVILNDEGTMPCYALYYLNVGGSYRLMKSVSEINGFDDSTSGNIEDDPLFIETPPGENWWHIQPDSPCRDAGVVVNDTNAGVGGWSQLTYSGSAPDIGAYEYTPTETVPTRFNPQPTGTLSSGTTSTNISLSTNVNAICRYSNVSGTNYSDISFSFTYTNSTNHSTFVNGLENGQTYIYYVRCNSSDGYVNDNDFNITFSIDGHKADTNLDGLIDMPELISFISRWKASDGVTKTEVEEARDIWFTGGVY